jgi:tRNA G46 methylase TrmB
MRALSRIPAPPDLKPLALNADLPIDVEIGCGVGFHPLRYAKANPGRQLVAFERTKEKFEKFAARIRNHDPLPNLIALHGDALAWIAHAPELKAVDRYFILYPNPYPKESQKNLRFPFMPAFRLIRDSMKAGAELTLATNSERYSREAEEEFVKEWGLELAEKRGLPADFPPRTHFEKKYLARGERCWNLVFRLPPQ